MAAAIPRLHISSHVCVMGGARFEFIKVTVGSAGTTLAKKLAEGGCHRILLAEADAADRINALP